MFLNGLFFCIASFFFQKSMIFHEKFFASAHEATQLCLHFLNFPERSVIPVRCLHTFSKPNIERNPQRYEN